jgi:hypothetical protein
MLAHGFVAANQCVEAVFEAGDFLQYEGQRVNCNWNGLGSRTSVQLPKCWS